MRRNSFLGGFLLMSALVSCKMDKNSEGATWRTKKWVAENQTHNTLLEIEKEQGWTLLFNGKTLEGWHLFNKPDSTALSAWEVRDGILFCNATDENKVFGDLVTDKEYENYELVFEFYQRSRNP